MSGVPQKDAYRTDRIGCRQQTLFLMLEWATLVPQMPKTPQVLEARVLKHSQYLASWLRRKFSTKRLNKTDETKEITASNVTFVLNKAEDSPGMPSVMNVKELLHITAINLQLSFHTERVLVLCDSACSNSWISEKLARKLNVQGAPLKLTVHGINSHGAIDTQIVELKLTPVLSGGLPGFRGQTVCEERPKRWN